MPIPNSFNPLGTLGSLRPVPSGYIAKRWLEANPETANSGPYVDTGIAPDLTTRWEICFRWFESETGASMGCYSYGSYQARFQLDAVADGSGVFYTARQVYGETTLNWANVRVGDVATAVIDNPNQYCEINGARRYTTGVTPCLVNIHLFLRKGNYEFLGGARTRIFWSKIFKGGELVQDLSPVVRTADGAKGFYDHVSGEFFGPQGAGEFLTD